MEKKDLLSILPLDVTCEIFSLLSPESVLSARVLSKHFARVLIHDGVWRNIVKRVYGVSSKDPAVSWYMYYKLLIDRWYLWDTEAHHPGITIDSTGMIATCDPNCKNDTHLPLRGRQGVKEGRYYFEISLENRPDTKPSFSSLLCAIGVADKNMLTDRKVGAGYTKDNNGIGYYSSGFQFANGKDADYGPRITYKIGNRVGFLLDMNIGEITFFRDSKPVGKPLQLKKEILGKVELFPVVLTERGLVIKINKSVQVPSIWNSPANSPMVPVKQVNTRPKLLTLSNEIMVANS